MVKETLLATAKVVLEGELSEPSKWMVESALVLSTMSKDLEDVQRADIEALHSVRNMVISTSFFEEAIAASLQEGAKHSSLIQFTVELATSYISAGLDEILLGFSDAVGGIQNRLNNLAQALMDVIENKQEYWADPMPFPIPMPFVYDPDKDEWVFKWPWEGKRGPFKAEGVLTMTGGMEGLLPGLVNVFDGAAEGLGNLTLGGAGGKVGEKIANVTRMVGYLNADPEKTLTNFIIRMVTGTSGWRAMMAKAGD